MSARAWERGLWCATIVAAATMMGVWIWADRISQPVIGRALSAANAADPTMFDADSLAAAADEVVSGDLFESDRVPSELAPITTVPPSPAPVRQYSRLVLRGVVGGPPWDVIVDGVPGRASGTVVREGETVSGLSFRVLTRDSVRVRTADTTWTLVLGAK
jgi:hypothetical protein